jgi:hypothetical protein
MAHARWPGRLLLWARRQESGVKTRVLVAMEDEYRAYREVIAAGIDLLRPNTEVTTAGLDTLQEEVARLEPQLVICSRPEPSYAQGKYVWVELPVDLTRPMKVSHGGRTRTSSDLTLEGLLAVIDAIEENTGVEGFLKGCQ